MATHDDIPGGGKSRLVDVIYGKWPISDSLVFVLRSRAVELVDLREAFTTIETWGEFRRTVSPWALESVIELFDPDGWQSLDDYREEIDEADPIVARERWLEDLAGGHERELVDEDHLGTLSDYVDEAENPCWPDWLQQSQLDWMPDDVIDDYGDITSSTLDGWFVNFAQDDEAEILGAMRANGYHCIRDDELVERASGFDRTPREWPPEGPKHESPY